MKPILCNYYLTLKCNSRCTFCNIWKKGEGSNPREQNLDEIKANLRDLKKLGIKVIDFTGGEPLLYQHIIDTLHLAKEFGFYTSVTTNCILYPKFAAELKGLVDILQFSLDSTDRDEHNSVRGTDCYDKVIESISVAKKLKQKISLIHTLTDQNSSDLSKMVEFAQANKCTLAVNPCFNYFDNESLAGETVAQIKRFSKKPYVVMDLGNLKLIENGGNTIEDPVCRAISSTIVISPDNSLLLPCYHHATKRIKIENNLFAVYNSEEVKALREKEGRFDFCSGCTIYCYMRSSLYRKVFSEYSYPVLTSACKYLRERCRRQF